MMPALKDIRAMKEPHFFLPFLVLKCRISLLILWAASISDIHCTFNYNQPRAYGNSYDVVLKEQMETASNDSRGSQSKQIQLCLQYNAAALKFRLQTYR